MLCSVLLTPRKDWSEEDWDREIQKAKQKEKQRKEELKQFDSRGTQGNCSLLPPSPQYKPVCEEEPPTLMRELPPEPYKGGHSDHNRTEEEKRKMLELLNEEFDLDYYSELDSDSDTDYGYQTLV